MHQEFDAFVFDMDGTLLDSAADLVDTTNATMEHFGFPTHTTEAVLGMVGNGLRSLILQALPQGLDEEATDKAVSYWKAVYDEHGDEKTHAYTGVIDMLRELKARGKKLAVLSNKYDRGVQQLSKAYFGELMDFSLGEGPVPRKPDPAGLLLVAKTLGVPIDRVAYSGDSDTDIQVAHNAGAFAIGVSWGYQPRERVMAAKPDAMVDEPAQLLDFA